MKRALSVPYISHSCSFTNHIMAALGAWWALDLISNSRYEISSWRFLQESKSLVRRLRCGFSPQVSMLQVRCSVLVTVWPKIWILTQKKTMHLSSILRRLGSSGNVFGSSNAVWAQPASYLGKPKARWCEPQVELTGEGFGISAQHKQDFIRSLMFEVVPFLFGIVPNLICLDL